MLILAGGPDRVDDLAFSPDGAFLAAGGAIDHVTVWDLAGRRSPWRPPLSTATSSAPILFDDTGLLIATYYTDIVGLDPASESVRWRLPRIGNGCREAWRSAARSA